MSERTPYWFYAKKYGWGWGMPARWEGWAVLIIYLTTAIGLAIVVAPRSAFWFWVCMGAMFVVLVAICWKKGEPPRWRWG